MSLPGRAAGLARPAATDFGNHQPACRDHHHPDEQALRPDAEPAEHRHPRQLQHPLRVEQQHRQERRAGRHPYTQTHAPPPQRSSRHQARRRRRHQGAAAKRPHAVPDATHPAATPATDAIVAAAGNPCAAPHFTLRQIPQEATVTQQVPLDPSGLAAATADHGVHAVTDDLAYARLALVNVVFSGAPDAGDRGWVVIGMTTRLVAGAAARFGADARPSCIILTHGHFDHVGALPDLAERWDVPVYAHPLEHPYLDGSAAYPPPDPTVGGGLMSLLSPLYPRGPIDLGSRLRALPADGTVPDMPGWRWLHAPGHAVGQVALWRESDRTLLAADAFITTAQESAYAVLTQEPELHGPPMYYTADWGLARDSVVSLAALEPERAVSGHGPALHGPDLRRALHALAADFDRLAVPDRGRYTDHPARAADGTAYIRRI